MRILFLDAICPKPYTEKTLEESGLGGTEATVLRVARGLVERGHWVVIMQKKRVSPHFCDGITYAPLDPSFLDKDYSAVVVLRDANIAAQVTAKKVVLWCHDWMPTILAGMPDSVVTVAVSDTHLAQLRGYPNAKRIYNPLAPYLESYPAVEKKDQIIFFSSPHKGLRETLEVVKRFADYETLKNTRFLIANPGYMTLNKHDLPANCEVLGELPHHEVMKHVAESFAVLHCNRVFPETFGLVHIEAQAVGTPFINQIGMGANAEISSHPAQLMDTRDIPAVLGKLCRWKIDPPRVSCHKAFHINNVIDQWVDLLEA